MTARVLEGFAGPGGLSEAARMIGLTGTVGFETNADACATARAAGYTRQQVDIRTLNPHDHPHAQGWVSGPPCPTYSASGLHTGRGDYNVILNAVSDLYSNTDDAARPFLDTVAGNVTDPRTALVLETLEVATSLPSLQWLVAEQVPSVDRIWMYMAADLVAMYQWRHAAVVTLRADDFGAATRRTRVFLIATRDDPPNLDGLPYRSRVDFTRFGTGLTYQAPNMWTTFPRVSMADALGWPAGVRVNTRGDRQTPGGNEFSADGPAPGLTHSARSWYRTDLGKPDGELQPWQAGVMQGFPKTYPWRGARTSQFQRCADSVSPLMGAAVLGAASGRPWRDAVWARLEALYGRTPSGTDRLCSTGRDRPGQPSLFEEAA